MVHELKAKDIEEYRKKIVERDKNKEDEDKDDKIKEDEDKGIREHRRRMVVQRDTNKGEGSKFDKRAKKDDKDGDAFQIDDTNDDRNHLNGIKVTIVGFGPKNENSTTMQQISQKIMPYKYCNGKYKRRKTPRGTQLRRLLVKKLTDGFDETLMCAKNP